MAVTTVARAYQSPDGAFSLEVPAGWKARKEEGSNEVSFLLGNVTVSVGTITIVQGETVERWMEASKALLKEQCVTAEIQAEGKTTVAGAPGLFFTMYCPGPRLPTTVRESAALSNGRIFIFNITAPTLQLAASQAAIDSMANSFRAGVEKHPEHADAVLEEGCAAGKDSQADCATPVSYQDPAHRFSFDIPAGWTLTKADDKGVVLAREDAWISVNPRKGERLEETLAIYARETQRAYTDLLQRDKAGMDVNSHRALTSSFAGIDKQGTRCFVGITDIDLGKDNSLVIGWSARQDDVPLITAAVRQIQQGIW
jgi:uncharacterized protein YbdZ (MbtH family)